MSDVELKPCPLTQNDADLLRSGNPTWHDKRIAGLIQQTITAWNTRADNWQPEIEVYNDLTARLFSEFRKHGQGGGQTRELTECCLLLQDLYESLAQTYHNLQRMNDDGD